MVMIRINVRIKEILNCLLKSSMAIRLIFFTIKPSFSSRDPKKSIGCKIKQNFLAKL
jgi:hypothetical protein